MASGSTRLSYKRLAVALVTAGGAALGCALVYQTMGQRTTIGQTSPPSPTAAPIATADALAKSFDTQMKPFLQTYCVDCHAGTDAPGALDLNVDTLKEMEGRSEKLLKMAKLVTSGQMPPVTADHLPKPAERTAAVAWLRGLTAVEVRKGSGDPGIILAHRLSNVEYNYTIHDLTGVDIQPAKEFPVDPTNQAGFDNSGESLIMDPELTKKYLEAAHLVADYMVFQSDGLGFAPHPAVAETDRDKYCVNRIIDFYKRQPTDLGAYLAAAWRFERQKSTGITIDAIAAQEKVSAKYLKVVYAALTNKAETTGPTAALAAWWRALKDAQGVAAENKLAATMADWVHNLRAATRPVFPNLSIPGMQGSSQPFLIWKVLQLEATRNDYLAGSGLKLPAALYVAETPAGAAMKVPADEKLAAAYEKAFERFSRVFPDEYVVTERAPANLNPNLGEGRLKGHFLNAGLHNQTGYFRDDRPLYDLILSDADKKELDRCWADLNMITNAPLRQFQSMIWFERTDSLYMTSADFNFVRAEDSDLCDDPKFSHLREVFMKDLSPRASPQARQAVVTYFDYMRKLFDTTAADRTRSVAKQLDSLVELAAKAYRRPLSSAEKQDILSFYHHLRTEEGLEHEDAVRDAFTSVLMSPYFCYRFASPPAGPASVALGDYELASRLSYFLWSTMPDADLLAHAAKGDLHQRDVLLAQVRRMLKDDRIVNLATEFGGNWLDFRQFETHNGVDREKFPTFTNELREAMYQEPIHFLTHMIRDDASVLDVLYGDYTYVNAPLAKHYGMTVNIPDNQWVRVDSAHTYDRGGILPMAVFLTKNSPGLRTSPVKRGNWVVKRVLGEEIPPPPADVPALPPDESKLELTLPETLARHRSDTNCATCHVRFDAMGLVFEGYGPIGQARQKDMAGKPVENKATFPDGENGTGLTGLQRYVKGQREGDFLDNLCRKLLADALGRTLILSDEEIVERMRTSLEKNNYHFASLVENIVTSPQFLTKKSPAPH